jgi:hypothetical protein
MWWASLGPAASQTPQDSVLMVARYFLCGAVNLLFIIYHIYPLPDPAHDWHRH